jgi:two-component system NtrC family sensor kinase
MKQTLKFKFLFCIAALIVCAMGVTTAAVHITSKHAIHKAITERLFQMVNSASDHIALWIHDRKQDLSDWSAQPQYCTALEDSYLGRAARDAASQRLNKQRVNYSYYESLNLANVRGEIISSSDKDVVGKLNIGGQPFFEEALKGGLCLTSVIKSPVTQNNVFVISVPVRKGNDVEGVFYGIINIDSFNQLFILPIKIGKTGYAYLVGPDGKFIAHPDNQTIFNVNVTDYDWGRTMMSKENDFLTYSWKGIDKIAFFRKHKDTGWIMAAAVGTDEVFTPVRKVQLINLAVTVLFVAIAILSITILYKRLIQVPMSDLMDGIARFGRGELKKKIQYQTRDEFGLLAQTINKMAEDLNQTTTSIDNLNSEVADRKKAEDELLRLLSLHDATLEATADGILVIDLNGNIVSYNQKFVQLWGLSGYLTVNKDHGKLIEYVSDQLIDPKEYLARTRWNFTNAENATNDILQFKDGRVYERISQPQKIGSKIVGHVRSFRDITDRVKAEQATADAYAKLKATSNDLVSAQSQLIQSEKLSSIGQLAAGVAHEINNPVGFVSSNFETLQNYGNVFVKLINRYEELVEEIRKSADSGWKAQCEAIHNIRQDSKIDFILEDIPALFDDSKEGLDRITKIIQSLRDFSRVDQVSDFCEYDLNGGIQNTLVVAKNEVKYDCQVRTELGEIPPIFCSSGQINQVILNIVVNAAQAIRAQNKGTIGNIIIQTSQTDQHVICQIIDDGPGIPPGIITKVFDPFFTTKPVGKGTGLGLSISRDIIVNKHKGELIVDSIVGQGTTFTIKLPIHADFTEEQKSMAQEECSNG